MIAIFRHRSAVVCGVFLLLLALQNAEADDGAGRQSKPGAARDAPPQAGDKVEAQTKAELWAIGQLLSRTSPAWTSRRAETDVSSLGSKLIADGYPVFYPDFSRRDSRSVLQHFFRHHYRDQLRKSDGIQDVVRHHTLHLRDNGLLLNDIDAAEALVLWLGGLPRSIAPWTLEATPEPQGKLSSMPKIGSDGILFPLNGGFDFDTSRLRDVDDDGWPEYYPPSGGNRMAPYVYFDMLSCTEVQTNRQFLSQYPSADRPKSKKLIESWGVAVPYVFSGRLRQGFGIQVQSSGFDGKFCLTPSRNTRVVQNGSNVTTVDYDNIIFISQPAVVFVLQEFLGNND